MSIPKIGIVIGTTREGRFGEVPARWLQELGQQRRDLAFEIVDLRDYPLPFFDEAAPPAYAAPKNEVAVRWATKLAALDGFVVTVAEYNHSMPAVLKNALDYAYAGFNRKPIAMLGYGSVGGSRAVEHVRQVASSLQMVSVPAAVSIGWVEYLSLAKHEKRFEDHPHLAQGAAAMLDDLAWWAHALKAARQTVAAV